MADTSTTAEVIAWLREVPGRTQTDAAGHFGLTQAAISYRLRTWRKQNPGEAGIDGRRGKRPCGRKRPGGFN